MAGELSALPVQNGSLPTPDAMRDKGPWRLARAASIRKAQTNCLHAHGAQGLKGGRGRTLGNAAVERPLRASARSVHDQGVTPAQSARPLYVRLPNIRRFRTRTGGHDLRACAWRRRGWRHFGTMTVGMLQLPCSPALRNARWVGKRQVVMRTSNRLKLLPPERDGPRHDIGRGRRLVTVELCSFPPVAVVVRE